MDSGQWTAVSGQLTGGSGATVQSILQKEYDLGGERAAEKRQYQMVTKVVTIAEDGTRVSTDTYKLDLSCTPGSLSGKDADTYTCRKLTIQIGDAPEASIPALDGWSYPFKGGGYDEQGQVLGIPHAKFEGLTDSTGNALPPQVAYLVYNNFIDFHAFCDIFARPTGEGGGIEDLKQIGQKIVHAAAFTEPPTSLGSNIGEGSFFKNGEVTLEFKGLSVVDGVACAVVGYDSGDSSFKMLVEPMPDFEVETVGGSHYYGDLYVELDSKWVRKVTMGELVVAQTTVPEITMGDTTVPEQKIKAVIERATTIRVLAAQ